MVVTINPDQHAAVLRVSAYHRRDFDLSVVCSDPQKHSAVQPFISEPFPNPATAPLGALRHLPNEVLAEICSYLDVLSSFKLRQVSREARQVVSASPAYRDLSKHCLESLRGALRMEIADWLPVADLHRVLCTSECSRCGCFGPLLFLPMIERCCYRCLVTEPEFRQVSLSALSEATKVSTSRLRELVPVLHTIPGKYHLFGPRFTETHDLVAERAILQCPTPLDIQDLPDFIPEPEDEHVVLRCMMATAFPYLGKASSDIDGGVSCKGCLIAATDKREVSDKTKASELMEMSYSREGFLVHFQSCEEAQKLWQASHGGTVEAAKFPYVRNFEYISADHPEEYYN
ncbi:unnamed protein product [Clonostachys solani]|uniref:F-box domain-containing protein n=1 Tax=Clonostachys solani TaxID=160281 RepID=A0A9N9YXT4_9HYPO|nr:unnamed protein product [Clonostachys solani]